MVEEKEGKRGKQTHGLLILGGTGESTRRPGPSDEQHTLGAVGLVHPLYSTQYVYQLLLHTHTDTIINMYTVHINYCVHCTVRVVISGKTSSTLWVWLVWCTTMYMAYSIACANPVRFRSSASPSPIRRSSNTFQSAIRFQQPWCMPA